MRHRLKAFDSSSVLSADKLHQHSSAYLCRSLDVRIVVETCCILWQAHVRCNGPSAIGHRSRLGIGRAGFLRLLKGMRCTVLLRESLLHV